MAHDNPRDQRFHASVMLGFTDFAARDPFFAGDVIHDLSNRRAGPAVLLPALATSLLVAREDFAVLDVGEGGGEVVSVDRGDQRCQLGS